MADHKMNQEEKKTTDEENIKSMMYQEAKERMELLQICADDIDKFFEDKEIRKIAVDHENMRIGKLSPTAEEMELIRKIENEREYLVYYLIQDEGMWPDGCTFPRYTVLYVDKYKGDYQQAKTAIEKWNVVPAYVINQEEPDCSEITEIGFRNVSGLIINIS